jgi:high affinity Mn2+ porin
MRAGLFIFGLALLAFALPAKAQDWGVHGQATFVEQFHPAFPSAYRGENSLDPAARGDETFDTTLFAGLRLWDSGEIYADPEIDQGFGLSDTVGVAGFPSGEAYKIGKSAPYFRLQRLFFRQTFDLGGEEQEVDSDQNQLAGSRTADNLIVTLGKYSVVDIFDVNDYAHDSKNDFLNWAAIDSGAFDYAADSWAYTYGGTAELTLGDWTLRNGLFAMSRVPNSAEIQTDFSQFEITSEIERRYSLFGQAGKIKLLGFLNRARMGSYRDAIALGVATHSAPDTALVRRYRSRPGIAVNLQQQIGDALGVFLRLSANDGSQETYEFTEINRGLATGLSLKGADWGRADDTVMLALVHDEISREARAYFAAGGIGLLIGDGALVHSGPENIVEAAYSYNLDKGLEVTGDYQWILRPGYNADRGPVSVIGLRLHWEK